MSPVPSISGGSVCSLMAEGASNAVQSEQAKDKWNEKASPSFNPNSSIYNCMLSGHDPDCLARDEKSNDIFTVN